MSDRKCEESWSSEQLGKAMEHGIIWQRGSDYPILAIRLRLAAELSGEPDNIATDLLDVLASRCLGLLQAGQNAVLDGHQAGRGIRSGC